MTILAWPAKEDGSGPTRMAKGKAPAFQFYPGDWLRDTALRTCSVPARGLWMDMICIMHQGTPYGHLTINGVAIEPSALARMVGCSNRELAIWMAELETVKVFSRNTDGVIFSRRMVADENKRRVRGECGKMGGNPSLLVDQDLNQMVNQQDKVALTPSSSSSSSSSSTPYPLAGFSQAFQMAWDSWPAKRRTKREVALLGWAEAVAKLHIRHGGDYRKAEDWLFSRVRDYVKSPIAETKYCLGIGNWLSQGSYDDAPEAWQRHDDDAPPTTAYQEIAPI